ncbi:hypothetical protein O181_023538 [Austropuccinia psidii MF-1]|uniref:GAG-pre-integrase domain-containing protein n=1 Tax=Austropuccinia psidii MF-1 TaxID=1389203 RepID=A0A9Q3CIZ7_9BASI|nr:hypothetical protein [Austropuccinia psidii MF-1]
MPPDIMAYSILGKISRDSNAYDHVIDLMVLTMNSLINPQLVLDKLSELLKHKNTKDTFHKGIKTEKMDSSALLTNSTDYPYKLTYVFRDRKQNPKNTTHKPENCWAVHPELHPPPRNKNKKKSSEAKNHQTGFEALLSHQYSPPNSSSSLLIDCGATHHMFSDKKLFTKLVWTPEERIATSDPRSSLTCKGWGTVKIDINNESMTLHDCLYVPNITKNLVSLLDLCSKSITIIKNGTTFQLLNDKQVLLKGQIVNKIMTVNFNQPRTLLLKIPTSYTWHKRLGHPGNQALKSLGLKLLDEMLCDIYVKGKMTHLHLKAEAVNTATYLPNILPTPSKKNLSPYFWWTNQSPKIKKILTFGCKVIFLIPKQKRSWKLGPLGEEGVFLGFNNKSSSYRILKCRNGKVYNSRNVVFFEKEFSMLKIHKESNIPFLTPSWDNSEEDKYFDCQEDMTEEQTHPERSLILNEEDDSRNDDEHSIFKSCLPPSVRQIKVIGPRHPTFINSDITEENILPYSRQPAALLTETDPLTYNKEIKSNNCEYWRKAIKKEL